jgi:hypothetical protein
MELENPSYLEEKELIVFPSSGIRSEEKLFFLKEKILNKSSDKTSNKRRLVITTSTEPVNLIFVM